MKLKDLEVFVVAPPSPGWGGRYWIFTKLTTDNGIIGYGECYASTVGPKAMKAVIEDVFERLVAPPEHLEDRRIHVLWLRAAIAARGLITAVGYQARGLDFLPQPERRARHR